MSDSFPTQPPPVAFMDGGSATPTTQQLSPYIAAASSSHSSSSTASSIVIVVIIIASAVVVTASIYILLRFLSKRFHRSFRTFAAADDVVLNRDSSNNPNFRQQQQQCPPEPASLLDRLPLFTFASITGNLTGGDCSVCLSKFDPHDQLRLLPFCCHAFHAACIDTWIVSNQTCPLCRSTVLPSDSEILDKVVSADHSRGISNNSFRNGNMGSFRIEIGSISRRRDRAAVAADGEPRSYSIGSYEYEEIENILLDSRNDETFGDVSGSVIGNPPIDMDTGGTGDGTQASSRSLLMGDLSSLNAMSRDAYHLGPEDHVQMLLTEQAQLSKQSVNDARRVHDNQSIGHAESSGTKEDKEKLILDQSRASRSEDSDSLRRSKKESFDKVALSPNASSFDPSHASSKGPEKASSSNELSETELPPKTQGITSTLARPGSSASCNSDHGGPTSTSAGRGLTPSSSVGSLSSEKSMLNPHAKEFRFNPNAKSFVPSPTPLRPSSPVADTPFYYPANVASVTQMHGMPVGIAMGPSFAPQQPVIFNPQAAPMPQPYYHPNGPQYGQQMMIGQPRPILYMPAYPNDMPYKGREF